MIEASALHAAWRSLPLGTLDDLVMGGTGLVLAPHPDDESLGCGGLIARCVAARRPPVVVILTDGAASHASASYPPERLRRVRAEEVAAAVGELGLPRDRMHRFDYPDAAAPQDGPDFEVAVARLVALLHDAPECRTLFAPWMQDPHGDHVAAARIAEAVGRRTGIRVLSYPVWGWTIPPGTQIPTEPPSGWRLEIGTQLPAKRRAIEAHQSQYGDLITDDVSGFRLPEELLTPCMQPFEVFFHP